MPGLTTNPGSGVRASQLYNARGKKLFPSTSTITTSMMSIAVQTSASFANNNLKRRSEAATSGSQKKSFHEQKHSHSQSDIVLLRKEALVGSLHSLSLPQTAEPAEGKLAKGAGGGSAFFKKLFQR